jgi:hypothetical protein
MDRSGDELFTRAAFSENKDGQVRSRYAPDRMKQVLHARTPAEHPLEALFHSILDETMIFLF